MPVAFVDPASELEAVLKECARSKAAHGRCEKRALGLFNGSADLFTEPDTEGGLFDQLRRVLVVKKKDASVDRLIGFVAKLAANCLLRPSGNGGGADDDENEDAGETAPRAFVSTLLNELARFSGASNVAVRQRSCELIARILECVSLAEEEAEFDEADWTMLIKALVPRLQDKVGAVRAHACCALCRLQDDDEEEEEESGSRASRPNAVTAALLVALETDTCADVRRAAVFAIEPSKHTLGAIVKRTRDVDAGVRAAAYNALRIKVGSRSVRMDRRIALMRHGLVEREPVVRAAAVALLARWFVSNTIKSSPAKVVEVLGGGAHEGTARLALRALHAVAVALEGDSSSRDFDGFRRGHCNKDFDATMYFAEGGEDGALGGLEAALRGADGEDVRRESTGRSSGRFASEDGTGRMLDARQRLIRAMLHPSARAAAAAVPADAADLTPAQALSLRSRLDAELDPSAPKLRPEELEERLVAFSTAGRMVGLLASAADRVAKADEARRATNEEASSSSEEALVLIINRDAEEAEFVARQVLIVATLAIRSHLMDESSARALAAAVEEHFVRRVATPAALAALAAAALFAAEPNADTHLEKLRSFVISSGGATVVDEQRALTLATTMLGEALDVVPDARTLEPFAAHLEVALFVPALKCTDADARAWAVFGLGRRCHTSSTAARRLVPLLTSVARNTREAPFVRGRAVQSLSDAAVIHGPAALFADDASNGASSSEGDHKKDVLGACLVELMGRASSSSKALGAVAAEAAARIVLAGRSDDPAALVAELAVLYVSHDDDDEAAVDDEADEELELGSRIRLQQVLAVFFTSLFAAEAKKTIGNAPLIGATVRRLLEAASAAPCVLEDDVEATEDLARRTAAAVRYLVSQSDPKHNFVAQYEHCYAILASAANGAETHVALAKALACDALATMHPAPSKLLAEVAVLLAKYVAQKKQRLGAPAAKAAAKFADRCKPFLDDGKSKKTTKDEAPEDGDAEKEEEVKVEVDSRDILESFSVDDDDDDDGAGGAEAPARKGVRKMRAVKIKKVVYAVPDEDDIPRRPTPDDAKKRKPALAREADQADEDGVCCTRCRGTEDPESILLCDACDAGAYHLACLDPPLAAVPQGDWFCPACASSTAAQMPDDPSDDDDSDDSDDN